MMTMADSTYSPLHSSVCYDASNIAESTAANRGRQDSSGFICLASFKAFAWNSGAIVGFGAIQVFSIFARVLVLSMVVDQGALKEHDFLVTVLRCLVYLDVLVYQGMCCSFVLVEFRHDSPWRRKSIFYLFMNAMIGVVLGSFLSWILIAGVINMALPITEITFHLIFSCALCWCMIAVKNDWREDEKDKKDGVESDLEWPLIL
jgi:hypothetical protein